MLIICKNDLAAKPLWATELDKDLKAKFRKQVGRYQAQDWQQWGAFSLSWFLKKNHQSTQLGKLNIILVEENKSVTGSQDIPAPRYATEHLTRKFWSSRRDPTWIVCCTNTTEMGQPSHHLHHLLCKEDFTFAAGWGMFLED